MRRRPSSTAAALAHALAAASVAATLGACAPSRHTPGDTSALARAIGALRRSAVGDRRFGGGTGDDTAARSLAAGAPPHAHHRADRTATAYRSDADTSATTTDSAYGDPAEWPTRVIRFTTTDAPAVTIWVGDTVALPAPPAPDGTPASIARDLRWSSGDPMVATVSAEGVVVARVAGTARITAWRRVGQTVTPLVVRPAIRGRVVSAGDAPLRARVVARVGDWADSTWTGPGGWFALRPDRAVDGPATLRVDPIEPAGVGSAAATHAAALLVDTPLERLTDVDVVLLPTRWRITGGSYAGTVVPIRPEIAQGRARDALRLWHLSRPGRGRVPDAGAAVGWAPDRLPLPLAFDHAARGGPIGAADSVAFWRAARQLERDWGASLFVPATLPADGDGFGGIVVTVDPRISPEGLTTTGWNGDGDVYDAVVALRRRELLADAGIVTHELLHALGVGHAPYGLPSVMHPTADAASPDHASVDDIAYAQLLYAVRARSRPGRTLVGVADATSVDAASAGARK